MGGHPGWTKVSAGSPRETRWMICPATAAPRITIYMLEHLPKAEVAFSSTARILVAKSLDESRISRRTKVLNAAITLDARLDANIA